MGVNESRARSLSCKWSCSRSCFHFDISPHPLAFGFSSVAFLSRFLVIVSTRNRFSGWPLALVHAGASVLTIPRRLVWCQKWWVVTQSPKRRVLQRYSLGREATFVRGLAPCSSKDSVCPGPDGDFLYDPGPRVWACFCEQYPFSS